MRPLPVPALRRRTNPGRNVGFTLVELLVSIAIVVVLAAVAVFATRGLRQKAYQTRAMSSLRQVVAFSAAYTADNNGDINTLRWPGDPKEGGGSKWVSNTFWGRLQPYIFPDATNASQKALQTELKQRIGVLFSTSDPDSMADTFLKGSKIYHDGSGLPIPMAFNENLHQWGQFVKLANVGDPSQVLYATYGFGFFNAEDARAYAPRPKDESKPTNNIYYFDDKTMAAAFLDGHMESLRAPVPDRRFK